MVYTTILRYIQCSALISRAVAERVKRVQFYPLLVQFYQFRFSNGRNALVLNGALFTVRMEKQQIRD